MSTPTSNLKTESAATSRSETHSNEDWLIQLIGGLIAPLGYEVVHLEIQSHRQRILRIYIDHLDPREGVGIGIEDCVRVSRALDEPLDQNPEVQKVLSGNYELEVSSPGVDRPLRTARDYERFSGREVRIHVFRPLTEDELNNPTYREKNPKQKNFFGILGGFQNQKVVLKVVQGGKADSKLKKSKGKKDKAQNVTKLSKREDEVMIPLSLISKANLEPQFEEFDERE